MSRSRALSSLGIVTNADVESNPYQGDETMRDQITPTCDVAQPAIRELSLDEIEMIGGGFSWGGLVHKAEGIVQTAIHNVESHDWKQVGNDALNGAKIGGVAGGVLGLFAGVRRRHRRPGGRGLCAGPPGRLVLTA
jgi:hypothetical protein